MDCPVVQDVVLLVDSDAANSPLVKDFLRALLLELPMPPVRAGIVLCTDFADMVSELEGDRAQLFRRIASMDYVVGGMRFAPALQRASMLLAPGASAVARLALLITTGSPVDEPDAQKRAAELQASGAHLVILWVGSDDSGAPPLLADLANHHDGIPGVLEAPSFQSLGGMAASIAAAITMPCPCPAGSSVYLMGPDNNTAVMTTSNELQAGASEAKDCGVYFPGHTGTIILTCSDASVLVSHTCALGCQGRASIRINVGGLFGVVETSDGMASGGVETQSCDEVVAGSTGTVQIECFNGLVSASHSCALRCPGGSVVVASGVASGSNASLDLRVPDAGLDHGSWTSEECGEHVDGTTGSLGLICLGGQPQAFGQCSRGPAPATVKEECPREFLTVAAVLGGIGLVGLCVGLALCLYTLRRGRKSEPVVPLSSLAPIVPAPSPPPPRRFATMHSQTADKARTESDAQTLPQVYVELVRGRQLPLDLVCCIDSSYAVGEDGFCKSLSFLELVIHELEMPPARVGVVQFNHSYTVASEMTADALVLQQRLGEMTYQLGGKKLGPALQQVGRMLRACDSEALAHGCEQPRKKAVIVVTDGDLSDVQQAALQASAMKREGVVVVFVQVGHEALPQAAMKLASAPAEQHFISLSGYAELPGAAERVLERVVDVSMWVRRAKCLVNLPAYQEVADLESVPGYELMVPGWEEKGPCMWTWQPDEGRCLQDPQFIAWDQSYEPCRPAPQPLPPPPKPEAHSQTEPQPLATAGAQTEMAASCDGTTQTAPPPTTALAVQASPSPGLAASVQTEPLMKVSLEASRHAPLDLVICVDSSGSKSSGTLERAKDFVEYLASCVHVPEVRLALVPFHGAARVLCELTSNIDDFRSGLQAIKPRVSESRLIPALRHSLALLAPGAEGLADRGVSAVDKAVLVVTSSSPQDLEEAKHFSATLRELGAQLLFVQIAKAGARDNACGLGMLATPRPRYPRMGCIATEVPQLPRGIFEAEDDALSLQQLIPEVLQQLLGVTQRVTRARCTLPLTAYEPIQGDLAGIEGHEIQLPESVPLLDANLVAWEPWMLPQPDVEEPEQRFCTQEVQTEQAALVASVQTEHAALVASQAQTVKPSVASLQVQTDPMVKVSVSAWRHAPLDLVVCMDTSASFCLTWEASEVSTDAPDSPGSFIHTGAFERGKAFIDSLAGELHMPEVRLALSRLDSVQKLVCDLTGNLECFRASLHALEPSGRQTKFAPPLWHALRVFEAGARLSTRAAPTAGSIGCIGEAAKAVLVLTDGNPPDMEEAEQAAKALQAFGARLLIVKIQKDATDSILHSQSPLAASCLPAGDGEETGPPWAVMTSADSTQALQQVVPEVLRSLVKVTQRVRRARCTLPLAPHACVEASELESVQGHEVQLPEDVPLVVSDLVPWDPALASELPFIPELPAYYREEVGSSRREVEDMCRRLEQAELELRRTQEAARRREEERQALEEERQALEEENLRLMTTRQECMRQRLEEAELELRCVHEAAAKREEERRSAEEQLRAAEQERRAGEEEDLRLLTARQENMRQRLEEAELELRRAQEATAKREEERLAAEEKLRAAEDELRVVRHERRIADDERRAVEGSHRLAEERLRDLGARLAQLTRQAEEADAKAHQYKERAEEAERERDHKAREASRHIKEMGAKTTELTRTVNQLRAELANREAQEQLRDAETRAKASELRAVHATAERKAEVLQLRLEQAEMELKTWHGDSRRRPASADWLQTARSAPDAAKKHEAEPQDQAALASTTDNPSYAFSGTPEPLTEPSPSVPRSREGRQIDGSLTWRNANIIELIDFVRTRLEERCGSIDNAFSLFDQNRTGRITCMEMVAAMELHCGLSRAMATNMFRRLTQLARCERRGCLTRQDWVAAFNRVRACNELASTMTLDEPGIEL